MLGMHSPPLISLVSGIAAGATTCLAISREHFGDRLFWGIFAAFFAIVALRRLYPFSRTRL